MLGKEILPKTREKRRKFELAKVEALGAYDNCGYLTCYKLR